MKYAFYSVFLIYLISFSTAIILCKDNITDTEYIVEDNDVSIRLENLLTNVDIKMSDLNAQVVNSMHALESKVDHLNGKIENISHLLEGYNKIIETDQTVMDVLKKSAKNCEATMKNNQQHASGNCTIQLRAISPEPIEVVCDDRHGGNWIVVMRRFDHSVDFNKNWNEYNTGFGNLSGEFFIGMNKLHAITNSGPKYELLIDMITAKNITRFIKYSDFVIGSEKEGYKLKQFGSYEGDADNELLDYLDMKFTTKDVDNDLWDVGNCCSVYNGPWWYKNCGVSSLLKKKLSWHPDHLKSVDVLIRSTN